MDDDNGAAARLASFLATEGGPPGSPVPTLLV